MSFRFGDEPEKRIGRSSHVTEDVVAQPAILDVVVEIGGCEGPGCPDREQERTILVDALLDYQHRVRLSGASVGKLSQTGPGRVTKEFRLNLGELEPGEHCLLVTALEPAGAVVSEERGGAGGPTMFSLHVGESEKRWCEPRRTRPAVAEMPSSTCGVPVVSTAKNEPIIDRRVDSATAVWLHLDSCKGAVWSVVWVWNGELVGSGEYAPFLVDDGSSGRKVTEVPMLETGGWYAVAIREVEAGRAAVATGPVMVED